MKRISVCNLLLILTFACGPETESGSPAFSPYVFDFSINILRDSDTGRAFLSDVSVSLVPESEGEPTVEDVVTLTLADGSETFFALKCDPTYDDDANGAVVNLDCPSIPNADAQVLCDRTVSATAELTLNDVTYQAEAGDVTVVCGDDPSRLDILERPLGSAPEGHYCSRTFAGDLERFGFKNGILDVIKIYEDEELTSAVAYDYNEDGSVAAVTTVLPDGFVTSELTYEYVDGVVSSRTLTNFEGNTETCTFSHTETSFTADCPRSERTTVWDPDAKTITSEPGGKEFVFTYSGTINSLTEFATINSAQTANTVKPIEEAAVDGSVSLVYTYTNDQLTGSTLFLNGEERDMATYRYECE